MERSVVWWERSADWREQSLLGGLTRAVNRAVADERWHDQMVAVKIPTGEQGNTSYLRPAFIRSIVDIIRATGAKVVATETTTLYPGPRFEAVTYLPCAAANGFTTETLGVPLIVGDGLRGEWAVSLPENGPWPGLELAGLLAAVDKVVVISHFRGHVMSGTGGAVKHLGMGCLAKRGKGRVHAANQPMFSADKCLGCDCCIDSCVYSALVSGSDGKRSINWDACSGCLACLEACSSGAIEYRPDCWQPFVQQLGTAAAAVTHYFQPREILYVNCMIDLTPGCDCDYNAGPIAGPDVGFAVSYDPVAIDTACLDLTQAVWDEEAVLRSRVLLTAAEKAGAGRSSYVLRPESYDKGDGEGNKS